MELYVSHETVDELDTAVEAMRAAKGSADAESLTALAWHLRERNSRRALKLADEADAALRASSDTASKHLHARLALTRSEALTLLFDLDASDEYLTEAREIFMALGDECAMGDTCLATAALGIAAGDSSRYLPAFAEAVEHFRLSGDTARWHMSRAWSAYIGAYSDPGRALQDVEQLQAECPQPRPTSLSAVLCAAESGAKFWRDPPQAAAMALRAREYAQQAGLVRLSIMASSNAGWILECLGDFDAAMECIEWSVIRARQAGWPTVLASAMVRLGSVLRELGQLDRSHEVLAEAVDRFASLSGGIHKAIALSALGHTLLSKRMTDEAVTAYETSVQMCREVRSTDNLVEGVVNLARALSAAGRPQDALAAIAETQDLINEFGFVERGVAANQALAEIHAAHSLPVPSGMTAQNAPLHYLEQALQTGRNIEGWTPSAKLLMALAEAWADAGNAERAYAYAKEVIRAEQGGALKKAANRTVLMQVRHETVQAQAEAAHQRQLAAAMTQQSQTLERLGRIGQEITSNLDLPGAFAALMHHLGDLADAPHLSIWLIDEEGRHLTLKQGSENGQPLLGGAIPLHSARSPVAACVRAQKEILESSPWDDEFSARDPAAPRWQSGYFGPLVVKDRVLGAICFQSTEARAYGERELLIFRTLCSYVAIALDNSLAYQHLQQAQAQLEEASLTDPLTGLRNRRYLMLHADVDAALCVRQYEHARRNGSPPDDADLIFLLLDIDHFKQVNDTHGHAAGDAILSQMRARLEMVFRKTDHLVRWGGEEFLIVARATTRERAAQLAARVCEVVREEPYLLPDGQSLLKSCSVGFACYPFQPQEPRAVSWQEVVDLADIALYAAKRGGRNGWVGAQADGHALDDIREIKRDPAAAMRRGAIRFHGKLTEGAILKALEQD